MTSAVTFPNDRQNQCREHRSRSSVRALTFTLIGLGLALSQSSDAHANRKHATIVIDANTGATLSQTAADEPRYPASLTKMMTIYMAFDAMERGRAKPDTRIKISERAASVQPSKLGLEPGSDIALIDAIKALVTKSANDVAVAMAEHFGGSEAQFARDMTAMARTIGMRRTVFTNASGLPSEGQVTTARDMVTLGLRLQDDFPKLYPLFAAREFTYNGRTYVNHNTMLGNYEGTDGIKTGYIAASGFNLVSNVRRGQKHVVAAVFGGPTASSRNQTMRQILNLGLFKASTTKTRQPSKPPARSGPQPALAAKALPPKSIVAVQAPVALPPAAGPIARLQPVADPPSTVPNAFAVPTLAQTLTPAERPQPMTGNQPVPTIGVTRVRTVDVGVASAAVPPTSVQALPSAAILPRGLPPSTLQAQAQAQQRPGVAATPERETQAQQRVAPAQPPTATTRLGKPVAAIAGRPVQIQVGAHRSKPDAERHLATVRTKAGALLTAYPGSTIEARNATGIVHRVRFSGLDGQRAAEVCTELRRLAIDCLVTQAE